MQKILIPLLDNDVAPRFDLATDVLIIFLVWVKGELVDREDKVVVFDHASPEDLCRLVITENIGTVICGGIEDEFYDFLTWKEVQVLDDVVGAASRAVMLFLGGELKQGAVLYRCQD